MLPFDVRWCWHSNVRPIWNEPRPELAEQAELGARFLISRTAARKIDEGPPISVASVLPKSYLLDPNCCAIPLRVMDLSVRTDDGIKQTSWRANLSSKARMFLRAARFGDPDKDATPAELIWWHSLAIAHSPRYLFDNRETIVENWPHIPLPAGRDRLTASAALGQRLADLLDPERSGRRGQRRFVEYRIAPYRRAHAH